MDIDKIKRDLDEMAGIKKSDDRLAKAKSIYSDIEKAEAECAQDFSIPFDSVKRLRELIPIAQGHVSRLEAGARRRRENAERRSM